MAATSPGAAAFAAFVLTGAVACGAMFAGVIVTAAASSSMSAREAGDLLLWMGVGQLVAVAGSVAGFRWVARRFGGATPPWWAQALLGVSLLAAAAMLLLFAMVAMNR